MAVAAWKASAQFGVTALRAWAIGVRCTGARAALSGYAALPVRAIAVGVATIYACTILATLPRSAIGVAAAIACGDAFTATAAFTRFAVHVGHARTVG